MLHPALGGIDPPPTIAAASMMKGEKPISLALFAAVMPLIPCGPCPGYNIQ